MPPTVPPSCSTCVNRRTILKCGALGVALAALPDCGERPLPDQLSGDGGASGTAGSGAGGGRVDSGSGGAAGSGAGGSGAGGATNVTCSGATIAIGNPAAIALGTLQALGGQVVVGRDAGGLYALSNICTHQGCVVGVVGAAGQESLLCPCHGSAFDANGAVTRGPARTPLPHYQIAVSANGGLAVCAGTVVAATTRVPVP